MNDPPENLSQPLEPSAEELIEYARHQAERSDLADLPPTAFQLPQDSFPGYTLEDEIHRGGQGVVYRATHHATKRQVAVKVIRLAPLSGAHEKARFEREVQVLGRLRHANIVALHDGGVSNGLGFLVTDYVEGVTLDEFVRLHAVSTEESLRLFVKICHAVSAAHVRGIVHRDLKPSNIRVDEHGEPHILDFGLAKLSAPNGDAGERVTITGQFVGSLPWAAPEQAEGAGNKIDIRTDVYALGMILFHLVTGRFPYDVAGSMREVVERIVNTKPVRPSTFRPALSDDLDTIALKCLSKEPERRYQSAGELARDMERYLAGEVIEAKRDSKWYVLRKTVKRNRGLALGIGAVVVLTVAYAATVTLLYRRAIHAEAQSAKNSVEAQNKFQIARDALSFVVGEVSERLRTTSGGREARKIILQGAYERLQRLTEEHGDRAALLPELARTHSELGDIALAMGNPDKAQPHFETALAIRRRLSDREPDDTQSLDELSISLVRVGDTVKEQGDLDTVRSYYKEALAIDERLVEEEPENPHYLDNLSWSYERNGWLAQQQRDLGAVRDYADKRFAIARKLAEREPRNPLRIYGLYSAHAVEAGWATETGDWNRILDHVTQAVSLAEQLVALAPGNALYEGRLADSYGSLGDLLMDYGKFEEAKEKYEASIAIGERLLQHDPNLPENYNHLSARYGRFGWLVGLQGDFAAMGRLLNRALELAEQHVKLAPHHPDASQRLFHAYYGLADLAHREGRTDDARRFTEKAIRVFEHAMNTPSEAPLLHVWCRLLLETPAQEFRDPAAAVDACERAVAKTLRQRPDFLLTLGHAYLANGNRDLANQTFREAILLLPAGDSPVRRGIENAVKESTTSGSSSGSP